MNKKSIFYILMVICLFWKGASFSQEYTPNEIIIKLKRGAVQSLKKNSGNMNYLGISSIDKLSNKYNGVKIKSLVSENQGASLKKKSFLELLDGFYIITFQNPKDIKEILKDYDSVDEVEYAQLNYIYRLHKIQNNNEVDKEWGLKRVKAFDAWEIERGSRDVLIAIIDTGIDYLHENLKANIWINPGEDINNNGIADASDNNGIDDDGNGYSDDIQGWDFTDVPSYPDDGDYLEPDNDPIDEMGHGTAIAGIAAAAGKDGVTGIASGCRIMNLRAATSRGYLQDDDVASAVIYAVQNGAHVINMSFGDLIYSKALKDIIRFAYNNGCVIVTSSGNYGDDRITYPAEFDETISVGAVNENDSLAQFSSFGNTIDVTAPGVDIYSTKRGNS